MMKFQVAVVVDGLMVVSNWGRVNRFVIPEYSRLGPNVVE